MANVQEQIEKASELERARQDSAALEIFMRVSAEPGPHSEDPGFWLRLGETARKVGNSDAAVKGYRQAIGLLVGAGSPNNALAVARRLVTLSPDATANIRYGQVAVELGYGGIARDAFFRAADAGAGNGDVDAIVDGLRATWAILRERGMESDAESVRTRIMKLRPEADPASGAAPAGPTAAGAGDAAPPASASPPASDDLASSLDLDTGPRLGDLPSLDQGPPAASGDALQLDPSLGGDAHPPLDLDSGGSDEATSDVLPTLEPHGAEGDGLPSLEMPGGDVTLPGLEPEDPAGAGDALPSLDEGQPADGPHELPSLEQDVPAERQAPSADPVGFPGFEGLEPPLSLDDVAAAEAEPDLVIEHPDERSLGLTPDLGRASAEPERAAEGSSPPAASGTAADSGAATEREPDVVDLDFGGLEGFGTDIEPDTGSAEETRAPSTPDAAPPGPPPPADPPAGAASSSVADDLDEIVADLEREDAVPAPAPEDDEEGLEPIPPAAELSLDKPTAPEPTPDASASDHAPAAPGGAESPSEGTPAARPNAEPTPEASREQPPASAPTEAAPPKAPAPEERAASETSASGQATPAADAASPQATNPFAPRVDAAKPPASGAPPAPQEHRDPEPPPPAGAGGEFIDLASLILGGDEDTGTRFQTNAAGQPSGDEDRDFAEILNIFRREVSQKIHPKDSSSHYDLGVAYKEMGLLNDAIAQLQLALRAGANPVATLEVIGECFLEKNEPSLAKRVLERATQIGGALETDLVGVLYWMARCEEVLANPDEARGHYERVIAVDISFRDAAERLRDLRTAK